jgi:hypothetical protein
MKQGGRDEDAGVELDRARHPCGDHGRGMLAAEQQQGRAPQCSVRELGGWRGVVWRRRASWGAFYRRAGKQQAGAGGDHDQWPSRVVALANGWRVADVGAVLGDDVRALASAGSAGEGRVERERGSACVCLVLGSV